MTDKQDSRRRVTEGLEGLSVTAPRAKGSYLQTLQTLRHQLAARWRDGGYQATGENFTGNLSRSLWVGGDKMARVASVLDREMYTEAGAARLLRVPPATLHYWLEGRQGKSKTYRPVIRQEATGSNRVTWAEFIEAGLLRQYRRAHRVPMLELRNFIESLRQNLGVSYPLAHARPFVSGRTLVVKAQTDAHLDPEFALVAVVSNQFILTPAAQEFYERVTWEDDKAIRWRPDANSNSPVVVDPNVRFGAASVGGISTAILREQDVAGEDETDIAGVFGLTVAQVRWALSYEMANEAA
jgi:uncharacterized protein (DUF433 family)